MAAVPVCGREVRSVCLTCLRRAASGPVGIRKGCNVFRLVELIKRLEESESGGDFAPLNVDDVPGFDKLYAACEVAGVSFNSEGLRHLARRIAVKNGKDVAAVMGMRPDAVADCAIRMGLRPERASA